MKKEMRSIGSWKFSFCELTIIGLLGVMLVSGSSAAECVVVEDFESYENQTELLAVWNDYWVNGSGAEIFLDRDPNFVRDGTSIMLHYVNTYRSKGKHVGAWMDANPADLGIGPDWTASGANTLVVHFRGDAGNSPNINDRMWVELEDTSSNAALVLYDGDVNDLMEGWWHEWNIDLGLFDVCGVDLTEVGSVAIGFGGFLRTGQTSDGSTGYVWFDDIQLCGGEGVGPGLIAHWKFDEGTGTTAYDSVGSNHGTLINGPIWTTGQIGGALEFDGVDDYISCGTGPAITGTGPLSVSAWVKTDSSKGQAVLVQRSETTANGSYGTSILDDGRVQFWVYNGGYGFLFQSDVTVNDGLWHHIAVVRTNSTDGEIYVNGSLSGTASGPVKSLNNVPVWIGGPGFTGPFDFDGSIDDVRIYDRALSAGEIQGIYEGALENTAPVACVMGGDRVVEADSNCEGRIVLDGSCSSDADSTEGTNDDINDFDWYDVIDACDPNSDIYLGSGEVIECNLGLGEHLIVLEVTDKAGAFDSNEVVITVEDVTPPEFSLAVEPNVLWPPNGKMVEVRPEWEVSDNCDEEVEVSLVDISMSAPGDINDYVQIGDDGSIYLRAVKSKRGGGRIYTLRYQAVDDSGNAAQASATVTVPHKRGPMRLGKELVQRAGRRIYRRKLQRR